ncbi:hypothetical protein AUC70_03190 [Methyloceanibacter stevinii]|uniref:Uncharacterized protein n=1 Tax=Methyloceanibacter stevinii TaxID=1774970 RepID=A0A1E3VSE8_9HYPH|nr:hypothetical protein AUC70_03190 [Methyloceanibacter stevinii]
MRLTPVCDGKKVRGSIESFAQLSAPCPKPLWLTCFHAQDGNETPSPDQIGQILVNLEVAIAPRGLIDQQKVDLL